MKDPEFIMLRNRFLLGLAIALLIAVPVLLLVINRYGNTSTNLEKKIKNKETFVVILTKDKCEQCRDVEEVLQEKVVDEKKINYIKIDFYKSEKIGELLDKEYYLNTDKLTFPILMYYEKGKMDSYLENVSANEDLDKFIERFIYKIYEDER